MNTKQKTKIANPLDKMAKLWEQYYNEVVIKNHRENDEEFLIAKGFHNFINNKLQDELRKIKRESEQDEKQIEKEIEEGADSSENWDRLNFEQGFQAGIGYALYYTLKLRNIK